MFGNIQFEGIYPRLPKRLLPEHAAQIARNCWLTRKHPVPVPDYPALNARGQFPADVRTIHKYDGIGDAARWFEWSQDVFVAAAPITDDSQRRIIWTGQDYPRHTTTTIMQGGGFSSPGLPVSRRLGVPAPTAAPTVALSPLTDEDEEAAAETHAWVYTFVNDLGEEGPPSSPSQVLTRGFNADGTIQRVTVTMPTSFTGSWGIARKRIYRVATGTSGSSYLRVGEVALTTRNFVDSKQTAELSESLLTLDWDPPPADLDGLISLPNGVLAGFAGRDVYFSEPYQPHAWPTDYIQTVDFDIVGIGNFGTNIVVGTKGRPYIMSGAHPSGVSVARLEMDQPCASKHGFASIDKMGVVYASTEGLVLVGPGGTEIISAEYFDKADWQALNPSSMRAFYHDGTWVGYTAAKMIGVNPEMGGVVEIDEPGIRAHYRDPDEDAIYLVESDRYLHRFGTDPVDGVPARTMVWRSRLDIGRLRKYSAAQVIADGYPVTFRLYCMDADENNRPVELEVQVQEVTDRKPFRLKSDRGSRAEWFYEIEGAHAVEQVMVGSMKDMFGA